jgi:hypothetical protein
LEGKFNATLLKYGSYLEKNIKKIYLSKMFKSSACFKDLFNSIDSFTKLMILDVSFNVLSNDSSKAL